MKVHESDKTGAAATFSGTAMITPPVAWTPPGVKRGKNVEWMEKVTDEPYRN